MPELVKGHTDQRPEEAPAAAAAERQRDHQSDRCREPVGGAVLERDAIEAIGFGAAVEYLSNIGMDAVRAHEMLLTRYALDALQERFGSELRIYGPLDVNVRGGAVSFLFDGIHAHDISQVLDEDNVCVRAGHHCAKPLMRRLGVGATARASLYIYNDETDVDALSDALSSAADLFH